MIPCSVLGGCNSKVSPLKSPLKSCRHWMQSMRRRRGRNLAAMLASKYKAKMLLPAIDVYPILPGQPIDESAYSLYQSGGTASCLNVPLSTGSIPGTRPRAKAR
jgi:hypothetical protein